MHRRSHHACLSGLSSDDTPARFRLGREGLAERDRLVVDSVRQRGIPFAPAFSGGYSS